MFYITNHRRPTECAPINLQLRVPGMRETRAVRLLFAPQLLLLSYYPPGLVGKPSNVHSCTSVIKRCNIRGHQGIIELRASRVARQCARESQTYNGSGKGKKLCRTLTWFCPKCEDQRLVCWQAENLRWPRRMQSMQKNGRDPPDRVETSQ